MRGLIVVVLAILQDLIHVVASDSRGDHRRESVPARTPPRIRKGRHGGRPTPAAGKLLLVVWSRFCLWAQALVIVKPGKMVRMRPEDNVIVRAENTEDAKERLVIHSINEAAFGCQDEADLVDKLRTEDAVLVSLVAEISERIVGHILFSRMSIETAAGSVLAAALAPMAVLPEHQRRGIGGRMIRYGLNLLRRRGEQIVIVVGHPDYYPRFGFSSEKARSLESSFSPEAFMAIELSPGALDGVRGRIRYPAAFGI